MFLLTILVLQGAIRWSLKRAACVYVLGLADSVVRAVTVNA